MILVLAADPPVVRLEEPDDTGRMYAVVHGVPGGLPDGVRLAGEHVTVTRAALLTLAGDRAGDPAWTARLDAALAYARTRGWWDAAADAVLVHVEADT